MGEQGAVFPFRFSWVNAVPLAYTTAVGGHRGIGLLECFVIIKCTKFSQLFLSRDGLNVRL